MWQRWVTFFKQHRVVVSLLLLSSIALWLRLHNVSSVIWSLAAYDDSRDFLVAKHLVEYGQFIWRGPLAASGFNWLLNSPLYYYFLACLWFIFRNPTGTMVGWILITTTVVPLAYLIGKKSLDTTTGLLFALIVAVHPLFVQYSQELFQPHLMPVLTLTTYYFLLRLNEKTSLKNILIFIFFFSIPVHFHYGYLLLIPVFVFWLGKKWYQLINNDFSYKNIFLPLLATLAGFLFWVGCTFNTYFFDQVYFFVFNFEDLTQKGNGQLSFFGNTLQQLTYTLVPYPNQLVRSTLLVVLVLLFFLPIKKTPANIRILLSCIASLCLLPLFSGSFNFYHLSSVLPFFFLLMAFAFRYALYKNKIAGFFIIVPFLLIWGNQLGKWYATFSAVSVYEETEWVSRAIASDLGPIPTHFGLAQLESSNFHVYDYWATSPYWFHLEEYYNQPLVTLTNGGVNHFPMIDTVQKIYFICDHRSHPDLAKERCQYRFENKRNYLKLPGQVLYQSDRYTVHVYEIASPSGKEYYTPNLIYDFRKE
jgi:hypothetical protein